MSLWAHTLVKNEERYLWYSVMSVINYVDRILIWDTGSTDKTNNIIKEIQKRYPRKVDFEEVGEVDINQFTVVRQKMLNISKCDWVIIVDGDEVWWDEKIREVREIIDTKGKDIDSIVTKYYNIVEDIFHYQDESEGKYNIDGKIGNYNIRAFNRKIEGIKFTRPHGQQALIDSNDVFIQDRDYRKKYWIDGYSYLHFTNMQRSGDRKSDLKVPKRDFKYKYDIGINFPLDFYYPEAFFWEKAESVFDMWKRADNKYIIKALVQKPLKKLKRKIFSAEKSGY
jgi:hypothetical protein